MSSDSERDETFDEDMEAIRRACMVTGAAPEALMGSPTNPSYGYHEEEPVDDEDDEDLDLPRAIQERFSIPSSIFHSLGDVRPAKTLLLSCSDSDDDDFEVLQAVQRRFEQYRLESLKKQHEVVDVGEPSGQNNQDKKSSEQTLGQEYSVTDNTAYELAPSYGTRLQNLIQDSVQRHRPVDTFKDSLATTKDSQFPVSCLNLVGALKKNRSLQRFFRSKMMHIEAKMAENKDLRERIKCLIDFQVGCKRRAGKILSQKKDPRVRLTSLPKTSMKKGNTKSALYFGPAENSHVENYRLVMSRYPVSLVKQPWSTSDKGKLARGIKQQYQEMMLIESASDPDHSISSFGDDQCDVTSERFRAFIPLVNWERLASMYFTGRTGAECESRWLNCEDPLINNAPWTAEEERALLFICQEEGVFNWIDMASRLGTYRTPFKCLMRYQRSLNVHILKKEWTEDEDARLRAAVEMFGDKWQLVASTLVGRTGPQCSNRWRKTIHPGKAVGRWSLNEDKRLKVAVTFFGAKNWKKIAQFVPGRNQSQCRERWVECLDPSVNLSPWTEEEDLRLKYAIDNFGYCWSEVANHVSHRTDSQCRRRWKVLFPEEVPLLQAARKMQKAALISNFVDREDERPLICPSDFHSSTTENFLAIATGKRKRFSCKTKKNRHRNDVSPDALVQVVQQNSRDVADAMTSVEKIADGTRTRKGRVKHKSQSKQGKGVKQMSDKMTFHAQSVPLSPQGCANGLSWTASVERDYFQEVPQSGLIDDTPLNMTGNQIKLLEYTTSLKNEKRGRSRLLLKRDKSSQLTQKCDIAPPDAEPDAFDGEIARSGDTVRPFAVDSNSRANNVEEPACSLSRGIADDDTKLCEFMDSVKKKKRRTNLQDRGGLCLESSGNLEPTDDDLVVVGVVFCQDVSNVKSCNADGSLGCLAVEAGDSSGVVRMSDALPISVDVMKDGIGCDSGAPSNSTPHSNGKNSKRDKFIDGGDRSSDKRSLNRLKRQLRQGQQME